MSRSRAWRRYKDYTKAARKRELDKELTYTWFNPRTGRHQQSLYYSNLHQYSKGKIHCSCPLCSAKTRNKGKHKSYSPSINYGRMDRRRQDSMTADEKNFEKG